MNGFHLEDSDECLHKTLEIGKIIQSNSIWELNAAETIKGVNYIVAKKLKTESIYLNEMNKNWSIENISAKGNNLKDGEDLFFKAEKDSLLDFNYDGFYGTPVI